MERNAHLTGEDSDDGKQGFPGVPVPRKEEALNGLLVWAGLIAAAAFSAMIQIPSGLTGETVGGGVGVAEDGKVVTEYYKIEAVTKAYLYSNAAAFFLSSSAMLLQLINNMHGETVLPELLRALGRCFCCCCAAGKAEAPPSLPRSPPQRALSKRFRSKLSRGLTFLFGMGSMVSLAGLALGAAFLSATYITFSRHGSDYAFTFKVISIVGMGTFGFFTSVYLIILLAYFFAPDRILQHPPGRAPERTGSALGLVPA